MVWIGILMSLQAAPQEGVVVSGELRKWHRITLTFDGPRCSENDEKNPFRDYRLHVWFLNGRRGIRVPGFFAADGASDETSASTGSKWRVHFVPDQEGEWSWTASFRTGTDVASLTDDAAGLKTGFDGARGTLQIGPTDKTGRDHRARGILQYRGERYLLFSGSGEPFLKGGADSPENFLAYVDFDGTETLPRAGAAKGEAVPLLHRYEPHVKDWRRGDPSWQGGRGKGIIGALNYLASKGMNSVYFLTMNVDGDGRDVWPWTSGGERYRFDCSKLDQWERVFSHMDALGIMLHVVTQEQENDQLLDGGELGLQRRLYYRELIARFGHHLALVWNLGEENTNTDAQRADFCRYIRALDPYHHPIVVHTFPGQYAKVYDPLLGKEYFEGPSLQMGSPGATHAETRKWVDRSTKAGRPWFVCLDEIGPADTGVKPDADDPGHDIVRTKALWGNLMAGGAGVEWYFGYKYAHNDLRCEDWRSRDKLWEQTRIALDIFREHLPFREMVPADDLTSAPDDYCLAKPGEVYAIYLPAGGQTEIDLGQGRFWGSIFSPRTGGRVTEGPPLGPGRAVVGSGAKEDTLFLLRKLP